MAAAAAAMHWDYNKFACTGVFSWNCAPTHCSSSAVAGAETGTAQDAEHGRPGIICRVAMHVPACTCCRRCVLKCCSAAELSLLLLLL
jgi:hypothetical protein